jgi:hypothetical protein
MVKADLRKEEREWTGRVGSAVQRAISLLGWSLKEFAAAVDRDERQCSRWISGSERPQFDTLFAVEQLRQPLIVAFSEMAGVGVEVETVVRIRRTL